MYSRQEPTPHGESRRGVFRLALAAIANRVDRCCDLARFFLNRGGGGQKRLRDPLAVPETPLGLGCSRGISPRLEEKRRFWRPVADGVVNASELPLAFHLKLYVAIGSNNFCNQQIKSSIMFISNLFCAGVPNTLINIQ